MIYLDGLHIQPNIFAIFAPAFGRDARAVEWGGLENRCLRSRTQGSNPCLSATRKTKIPRKRGFLFDAGSLKTQFSKE